MESTLSEGNLHLTVNAREMLHTFPLVFKGRFFFTIKASSFGNHFLYSRDHNV